MNQISDQHDQSWSLVANGTSGRWDINVDQCSRTGDWGLIIDGPNLYLALGIQHPQIVSKALQFLERGQTWSREQRSEEENTFSLGQFASAPVYLVWDNEEFPRCFIKIGPDPQSTLHFSLFGDDISAISEALRQVAQDLAQS